MDQFTTDIPITYCRKMAKIVLLLVQSSLQLSSVPTCKRTWNLYFQFLVNTLPVSNSDIAVPPRTLALIIISLIAIMPHPLLALVFEPLVNAINFPVYRTTPTPFLLLRCATVKGRSGLA